MNNFDVSPIIWRIFMYVTLQAAVHLGKDYDYSENLLSTGNQPKRTLKQLFNVTGKLIRDQKQTSGSQ